MTGDFKAPIDGQTAGAITGAMSAILPAAAAGKRFGAMARVTGRGLWSRKRRLVGLVSAVFLGVAFLTGTLGLSATLTNAIDSAFTTAYQGTDVVVRNATATTTVAGANRGPIPGSITAAVRGVPGVADAQGELRGNGVIAGSNGQAVTGMGPRTADTWLTDSTLNPWKLVDGAPPKGPDEVVIDQNSANVGDLHVGESTTVYLPGPTKVTISGIAVYGDATSDGGSSYVAFTLAGAQQHLLDGKDGVTQIVVRAEPGYSQDQLRAAIAAVLPPGTQAITGAQATSDQIAAVDSEFLNFFKAFLDVFAAIALIVAMLNVHNTFGVVAAQRSRESALLRALGASRGQILRAVLGEAAVLGLIGSVAGLAAGYGLAAGLKDAFASVGFDLPISGVVFTVGNAALGLAVGLAVTVIAALTPAIRASRTAPVEALRESAVDTAGASRIRQWTGAALTVAGVAGVAAAALDHRSATVVGLAGFVTLIGVLVLGPVIATVAAGVLGAPVARLRGVPGQLARRNVARAPKRTAAAASALVVGVAIVVLFTVFGASLKASTGANLNQTFSGSLVVSNSAKGYATGGFSPAAAAQIAAVPGVSTAAAAEEGTVLLNGVSRPVTIGDPAQLDRVFTLGAPSGELAISSSAATANKWRVGSMVTVTFADGAKVPLRVGVVYQPISPLDAYIMPSSLWVAHTTQPLDSNVYVAFAPGADTQAATARIETIAKAYGELTVQDRAAYLSSQASMVDTLLSIVYVLLALAILIALLGIGNTLALAVYERTREIGLLRAVGASRAHVRSTIRWEAVLIALLGTVTGAALGVFLGWAVVRAVSATEQTGVVSIPWSQIVIVLVVGAIAGLFAGARPARRAARMDPLGAISTV